MSSDRRPNLFDHSADNDFDAPTLSSRSVKRPPSPSSNKRAQGSDRPTQPSAERSGTSTRHRASDERPRELATNAARSSAPTTVAARLARSESTSGRGSVATPKSRDGKRRFSLLWLLPLLLVVAGGWFLYNKFQQGNAEKATVQAFVDGWRGNDYAAMYKTLSSESQAAVPEKTFASIYKYTQEISTTESVSLGEVSRSADGFDVATQFKTRLFANFDGKIHLPLSGQGSDAKIVWDRGQAFPGLGKGERLTRKTKLPPRATLLDRTGKVIAKGVTRSSPYPNLSSEIRGSVGRPSSEAMSPEELGYLTSLGVPKNGKVGLGGLERILNKELIGTPGGTLYAADRELRTVSPKQADPVKSSISLAVVKAAIDAQAKVKRVTGSVVLNARTGEVIGFEGAAWSQPRAPGSTMKIITSAAALEQKLVKLTTVFPTVTSVEEPFHIENADKELCGGTLVASFAKSCNTVFAPLGAKIGSEKFIEMSERWGFNKPIKEVPGAKLSSLPTSGIDVARAAFGQERVVATPLQVAMISAIVANKGQMPKLTFLKSDQTAPTTKVVSPEIAASLRLLMLAVIKNGGTGIKAAVPGVLTAGKTGTAETANTQGAHCNDKVETAADEACGNKDGSKTDAWMTAFASASTSAQNPMAVGVFRMGDFHGGETAAPVASVVLKAALATTTQK